MADAIVKAKDLPILDEYENISSNDRLVASHVNGSSRQTVGITIGALNDKFINESATSPEIPRNLFGYTDPSNSEGKDGDLYFKVFDGVSGLVVSASYVKMNGVWTTFQVTDDNWRKFLEGQPFDLISYDAKSVKAYAFYQNDMINRAIMPSCEAIYEHAFDDSSITYAYFPNCTLVDEYAFYDCMNWQPGFFDFHSVETIGQYAFCGCHNNKKDIKIDISNVRTIGERAFYHTDFWMKRSTRNELVLPYCTEIGASAFASYGTGWPCCFYKVDLPAIETIGDQAFRCVAIYSTDPYMEFHIGPNCTSIGSNLFYTMSMTEGAVFDIYIEAINPPTFGGYLGEGCHPTHIYVPYQSVDTYKAASGWSNYASIIEAIPEEE